MYGTQAMSKKNKYPQRFENDVKMYGTQAWVLLLGFGKAFENDVKMYGTQAQRQAESYL